jgi:hypothetical protein
MAKLNLSAQFDVTQSERERHGRKRGRREPKEYIHVAQERSLCLHLRADPLDGLVVRLGQ